MTEEEARQELSGVENCKRIFLDGGVFSAAVCRLLVSNVLDVVSLRMRDGGRKERLHRQTATWPWTAGGGRRGLKNKALPGSVEQSTYLFCGCCKS
jgi:hypothetical protein